MNKSLIYISDFFLEHIVGGCELNDEEFLKIVKEKNYEVIKIQSHMVSKEWLKAHKDRVFVVSNFINLSQNSREYLKSNLKYIIYEHDHKYLVHRNPGAYPDFLAPKEDIINYEFYKKALAVFGQSKFHINIINKNLKINNLINLSGNLWSLEGLELLRELNSLNKSKCYAIMDSMISHKNTHDAIKYCKAMNIEYKLISSAPSNEFLKEMGKHKGLVFFPKTPETLSRIVVEARMMGMSTITTKNIGAIHEDWFETKGIDLIDFMINKRDQISKTILKFVQ